MDAFIGEESPNSEGQGAPITGGIPFRNDGKCHRKQTARLTTDFPAEKQGKGEKVR